MNENSECKKRFYDLEEEEAFLNEMSEKGLALKEIRGRVFKDIYRFEFCDKKYVYREDYNHDDALEEITSPYIKFVTETYGCEFVCIANGKVYFRKGAEEGDFPPVYTDIDSRIKAEKNACAKINGYALAFMPLLPICGLNIFNTYGSETVFGRIGFIANIIGLVCSLIYAAMIIPIAVKRRKKLQELEKIREENGGI